MLTTTPGLAQASLEPIIPTLDLPDPFSASLRTLV